MFCLELDHILPMNGPGHVEKKMLECVTKVLWDIIGLSEFASWCDFSTVKSQQFLQSFGDHHIGFDFLFTVQETLSPVSNSNILHSTANLSWPAQLVKLGVYNKQTFFLVNGPLYTSFLLRAGIRCPQLKIGTWCAPTQTFSSAWKSYSLRTIKSAPAALELGHQIMPPESTFAEAK